MKNNTGAQYEISADGVPRSYRDRKELALQGARFLKSENPRGNAAELARIAISMDGQGAWRENVLVSGCGAA